MKVLCFSHSKSIKKFSFYIYACSRPFCEKSKFSLNNYDNCLLDEDIKLLLEKKLNFETISNNEMIVKTLLKENKELLNKNNRLTFRIEHLLSTIKSYQEELEKLKLS
jgi:hypothetical protein